VRAVNRYYLGVVLCAFGCGGPPAPKAPGSAPAVQSEREAAPRLEAKPAPRICDGSIDEAIQRELAGRAARGRFCYGRLLERDPKREGSLTITVEISSAGTIDDARVILDELGDAETNECLLASFRKPLNGRVEGNCVVVNVPLRFRDERQGPPAAREP
jgi:hypothetical protein